MAVALLAGVWGCASRVSLDEPPQGADGGQDGAAAAGQDGAAGWRGRIAAGGPDRVVAERQATEAAADRDRGLWRAPVAQSFAVLEPGTVPGARVPEAGPGWAPGPRTSLGAGVDVTGQGQPAASQAAYEFEQKLDDDWQVKQSVRYGRPDNQPAGNWVDPGRPEDPTLPGLGTYTVGSQVHGTVRTFGLQHQVQFGFDYLKARDIFENRVEPSASLDILDPRYGSAVAAPRMAARAYSERSSLGLYVQDQIQLHRWTLSLVGRRDQLGNRTVDLATPEGDAILQDDQALSARAGLRYQFDNGLSPYLNYSQSTTLLGSAAATSTGQQIETGVRFQPPALGQLLTMTAYNQFQNNAQAPDAESGCAAAGGCRAWADLRIRGASIESRFQPLDGLNLTASYAASNSVVSSASADAYTVMLTNRYPSVSQQQVSLRANYAVSDGTLAGLTLDGRVGHTGAAYGGLGAPVEASYLLVDAGIGYDFGRLSPDLKGLKFRATASNLFAQNYWAYCYTDACTGGAARSISALLNYQIPWP
ncbi:hypothetical protein GCM10023144_28300 [Pigmentiphaga soli]|uniref:TonB-dependent receptor-like beta-barrel domain-containing protein n=1 Tax=Pigmentiphaga soli TaxID=1007095 RepID=A0ABP8H703_9BURK